MELKNLEKFIKLCRKLGVSELKTTDFEMKLGDLPVKEKKIAPENVQIGPLTAPYSDRDILFWSAGGVPPINEEIDA